MTAHADLGKATPMSTLRWKRFAPWNLGRGEQVVWTAVGSEVEYNLKEGDRIAVDIGGVIYTDTIASIGPQQRELNRRQRILRRLTPPRWRKSLDIPGTVEIATGRPDRAAQLKRMHEQMQGFGTFIDGVIRSDPSCVCGWRPRAGVIGSESLEEHQRWCSIHAVIQADHTCLCTSDGIQPQCPVHWHGMDISERDE